MQQTESFEHDREYHKALVRGRKIKVCLDCGLRYCICQTSLQDFKDSEGVIP